MKASYAPYRLIFKTPGGTSRGVLKYKDTYFIKIWDVSNPEKYGIGECAIFRGLSYDDNVNYENKLAEVCRNIENNLATDLNEYPSIQFGLEGAIYDFSNGCRRICFDTPFVKDQEPIHINGLVWMGTKEEMKQRIYEKISAGFKTLKLKVGAIDFDSELELVKYVRKTYTPEQLEIRLDANGGFTSENALERLERLSEYTIHSIEQPIKAGQWESMAEICKNSPIDIALDEELIGINSFEKKEELIKAIHPKYIILKPALVGGMSGATDWLRVASSNDVGGWITSALESNIGLNIIAQWVSTLGVKIPQGLGTGNLFTNNIQSPLYQEKDYLSYNVNKDWIIPDLDWK